MRKLRGDGPDTLYHEAKLDEKRESELTVRSGDDIFFSVTVYARNESGAFFVVGGAGSCFLIHIATCDIGYGNDVDCGRCGPWGMISMAANEGDPWDAAPDRAIPLRRVTPARRAGAASAGPGGRHDSRKE